MNAYHRKRDKLESEHKRGILKSKLFKKNDKMISINENLMRNRISNMHKSHHT